MGNYISCTLLGPRPGAIKIVFPSGEIRSIHQQIKAAEIMLETPNFFLVNSKSLHIGKRFSALNADEDLETGNVYTMFHMKRLNSLVSTADLGALFLTAKSVSKRVPLRRVKILPECTELGVDIEEPKPKKGEVLPKLKLENIEELVTPEFKHMLSMCRSKKPLLETIVEETSVVGWM